MMLKRPKTHWKCGLALVLLIHELALPSALAGPSKRPGKKVSQCPVHFGPLAPAQPTWKSKGSESLRSFLKARKEGIAQWGREVVETKGGRLFIKKRDQNQKLGRLHKLNAFLMNPIATAFNRPKEVTIPVSILGWTVFVEFPIAVVDALADEQLRESAERVVQEKTVPGASYVWSLVSAGYLPQREGSELVLGHEKLLLQWLGQKSGGTSVMPRVAELQKQGILSPSEAQKLDQMMRAVAHATSKKYQGSSGKSTEAFADALLKDLKAALQAPDSPFKGRSTAERELLSTAFWPQVEVEDHTDIELGKKLLIPDADGARIQPISKLLNQGQISIGEAYQMTARTLDHPKDLEERKEKGKALFPPDHQEPLLRPDIPRFAQSLTLGSKTFEDEFSRWETLMTDPRFSEIKAAWQERKIADLEAMHTFEAVTRGLEELQQLDRREGPWDDETVGQLFGIRKREDRPEAWTNPLLDQTKGDIALIAEKALLSSENILLCMKDAAEFWRRLHREETGWVESGMSDARFRKSREDARGRRAQEYEALLSRCVQRGK